MYFGEKLHMGKKVGIITSYLDFNKNYGGVLQAYALSRQIELLGYTPYIMPYIYEHIPVNEKVDLLHKIYRKLRRSLSPYRKGLKMQKQMHQTMLDFVSQKLPVYSNERMTVSDIKKVSNDFYAFVCGSDQVWSTKLQRDHCDAGMFLQFVSHPIRKIAYAPSMGSTVSVSEETANEIKQSLSGFDAISLRETKGQALIEEITGNKYPIVLDPTLLLPWDEWNQIATVPSNLPEKYILVYRFGNIKSNFDKILEIQKRLDFPIIELPSSLVSLNDGLDKRYDINAGAFIGLIKNAALVCTDSFHATVFSIINQTPFVCFCRQAPDLTYNMNGRITDLLKTTDLENRLILPNETVDFDSLFNIEFDYAHKVIEELRGPSLEYLRNALEGEVRPNEG